MGHVWRTLSQESSNACFLLVSIAPAKRRNEIGIKSRRQCYSIDHEVEEAARCDLLLIESSKLRLRLMSLVSRAGETFGERPDYIRCQVHFIFDERRRQNIN